MCIGPKSLIEAVARWRHVGGGTYQDGTEVLQPVDYVHAVIIDNMARRYGVVPSAILDEDTSTLRIIQIAEA